MNISRFPRLLAGLALVSAIALPTGAARAEDFRTEFDKVFGKEPRAPREVKPAIQPFIAQTRPVAAYDGGLDSAVASLANAAQGRIGVAAMDLGTGRTITVLGDQPFPMASTSKIAIARRIWTWLTRAS